MTLHPSQLALLHALYALARDGRRPTLAQLARRAKLTPLTALEALGALRAQGLTQSSALRLTLPGLALAVATSARGRSLRLAAA